MIRIFSAILFCILLSSCASTFQPAIHNNAALPEEDLASIKVKPYKFDMLGRTTPTLIAEIYTANGTKVAGTNSLTEQHRWKQAFLEPGEYKIIADCDTEYVRSRPEVVLELELGDTKQIECSKFGAGYSLRVIDIPRTASDD